MNVDVPPIVCLLRREYLFDMETQVHPYEDCYIFGLTSIAGKALLFTVLTSSGVVRDHLPISAFTTKPHEQHWPLDNHELWNCFSYEPHVIEYGLLQRLRCQVRLRDKTVHWGTYHYTVDWFGNRESERPGEAGHKSAHIIELECGCFVAQPNNRILWREASFVTTPLEWGKELPRYSINTRDWSVEQNPKWLTSDDDRWFFDGT